MATPLPRNRAGFTVAEVIAATGGTITAGDASARATSVSTNTREIQAGALFVALVGPTHDAHAYVGAAALAGATIAVVERDLGVVPPGITLVRVGSTMRALADLARAHVARWHALGGRTLFGITGSAGKTTTRVAAAALLESAYPGALVATRGNLNNRIGVPMMLFSLGADHRVCVVELGTSEPGEIAELCRMAEPDVGILTLVAAAHVEGLGSIEGVAEEKAALYRSLGRAGVAIGNGDDPRVRALLGEAACATRITYGTSAAADVRVVERAPLGMTRSRVVLAHADGRRSTFETPLVGEAGALASAAAVAAVEARFGLALSGEQITSALDRVVLAEGAARLVALSLASGLAVIDDTYNANPASMSASIRTAGEMARAMDRRLVLILGEMRELGIEAARGHEEVGSVVAASGAGLVIAAGGGEVSRLVERAREGGMETRLLPSIDDAAAIAPEAVQPSDLVLVKASRSTGIDRVVAALVRAHGPVRD